jgi:hypothetical protein
MCIGKGYDGSYYTVNKNMFHDLNAFYEVHEKGKCSDDADYSQDAKNHFVILEDGDTLADVASKSEVAREIFEEIEKYSELAFKKGYYHTQLLCIGCAVFDGLKKKYTGE